MQVEWDGVIPGARRFAAAKRSSTVFCCKAAKTEKKDEKREKGRKQRKPRKQENAECETAKTTVLRGTGPEAGRYHGS